MAELALKISSTKAMDASGSKASALERSTVHGAFHQQLRASASPTQHPIDALCPKISI
eukprot:jgi/Pico_ML_1/54249/g465.t1